LAFVAGYGIKIYMISQDTVQFDAVYTDKNSIISNCHIQVIFPPNRLEKAKYVSEMLGETTVVERQYSVSGKRAGMLHEQVTETVQMNKRPLLTPDEVLALPGPKKNSVGDIEEPGEMIVRVSGAAPIRGRQPLYFLDDVFLARAKIPAPLKSDRFGFQVNAETKANTQEMKDEEEDVEVVDGVVRPVKDEAKNGNGAESKDSAKPEPQAGHDQGVPAERVVEPEQQDQPESEQSVEVEDSAEPGQPDHDQIVSVEGGVEPEQSVEMEDSVEPEPSALVQGVTAERVEGDVERDQPELERTVGGESGHEIAR
jgi:hypothetical protein